MRETAERTATLEQEVRTRQQAETDARNAWARNDGILDVALDCVILMDESGRIVQFNPAAERTFGYTAAEAVGTRARRVDRSGRSDRSRTVTGWRATSTSGQTAVLNRRLELSAVRKGGETVSGRGRDRADLLRRVGDVRRLHARHHRAPAGRSRAGRADVAGLADRGGRARAHPERRFARHAPAVRRGAHPASRRRAGAHLDARRTRAGARSPGQRRHVHRPRRRAQPRAGRPLHHRRDRRRAPLPARRGRQRRSADRRSRLGPARTAWSPSPAIRCCSTASCSA